MPPVDRQHEGFGFLRRPLGVGDIQMRQNDAGAGAPPDRDRQDLARLSLISSAFMLGLSAFMLGLSAFVLPLYAVMRSYAQLCAFRPKKRFNLIFPLAPPQNPNSSCRHSRGGMRV